MTKYVVVKDFTDLQDGNHVYRKGKPYPRKGKPVKKRAEELSTKNNALKTVLIKEVDEK